MRPISIHLGCALAAGLSGSVTGTAASLPLALQIAHRDIRDGDLHMQDFIAGGLTPIALLMFTISLFFTFPSALLIGAPLTWWFRDWIRARPWPAVAVYAAVGGGAGLGVALLFVGFHRFTPFGGIYGVATGAAFALMLWLTRDRKPKEAPLDTIFE